MPLSAKEAMKRIGTHVLIPVGNGSGIMVECIIADYKYTYGTERWLVQPVAGTGEAWVQKNYNEIKNENSNELQRKTKMDQLESETLPNLRKRAGAERLRATMSGQDV